MVTGGTLSMTTGERDCQLSSKRAQASNKAKKYLNTSASSNTCYLRHTRGLLTILQEVMQKLTTFRLPVHTHSAGLYSSCVHASTHPAPTVYTHLVFIGLTIILFCCPWPGHKHWLRGTAALFLPHICFLCSCV